MRAARSSSSCEQSGWTSNAVAEVCHPRLYFSVGHLPPQRRQLVHLDHFDMSAEIRALLGEVGVDVEHAAVVMAHHTQAIVFHDVGDAGGFNPLRDFVPGHRIVFQHAGDLERKEFGSD